LNNEKILINKRYILWFDNSDEYKDFNTYEILEMTEITYEPDIRYWSETIYKYNSETNTLEDYYANGENFFTNMNMNSVLYQSNNLEELKNELISSNKYNL
jgi:hypothetical protein